jgi:pantoate--beta-alanine ligase
MTRVFKSIQDWTAFRKENLQELSLGFVPTMGALHSGHQTLMKRSVAENSRTLVSIFVNPTQFNDPKDLENYPSTYQADLKRLEECGVDYLLYPQFSEIYPDQYRYKISENSLSKTLCGAHRPGHFDGVLTIVMKLFNIAQADKAYFGEKDYQQYSLIQGMKEAFFIDTEIIPVATVREEDGLALSSRNVGLKSGEREIAPRFYRILSDRSIDAQTARTRLSAEGFLVDYVEEQGGRRFGACRLGSVRLIDNVKISSLEKTT